jgi:hypothetical protein
MAVNPSVLLAVADRLVQDSEDWESFDPYQYFPSHLHWAVSMLYPPQATDAGAPNINVLAESG